MKLLPFNDFDLKTSRILKALNEAKDSSEIENIITTHDSIYKLFKIDVSKKR